MSFFRIKKNDGSLDLPILEKAIDTLVRISDQAKLERETSNTQDSDSGKYGGLIPPQNIELTSYRETAGVTLSEFATVKASWAPVAGASYYDVELDTNESEGQGAYNKEARTNACFWQNMTLGITVKLRIRACNSVYKSEWSEPIERQVINGTYTSVGSLVITAKKLLRWVHVSVPKINRRLFPSHRGYEWQWSTTNGFTPYEKETETGDATIGRKLSFSNHAVFRVPSLTAQVYVRVRAYDWKNNKTAWSSQYSVLEEVPAQIDELRTGVLPITVGFFKKNQWRLNVEWDWSVPEGADDDMTGSFEIQHRRGTSGLWIPHFVDLNKDDKTGEHNIALAFQPKNETAANGYVPGENTTMYVRIRARENLIPGDWYPAVGTSPNGQQVEFAAPDSLDDWSAPTSKWSQVSDTPFTRFLTVQCAPETWDAPNTFSHFSIHVRQGGSVWTPDVAYKSKDRIKGNIKLETGISGVVCRVPWFVADHTTAARSALWPADIAAELSVKIVCHCYEESSGKYLPQAIVTEDEVSTATYTEDDNDLADTNSFLEWIKALLGTPTYPGSGDLDVTAYIVPETVGWFKRKQHYLYAQIKYDDAFTDPDFVDWKVLDSTTTRVARGTVGIEAVTAGDDGITVYERLPKRLVLSSIPTVGSSSGYLFTFRFRRALSASGSWSTPIALTYESPGTDDIYLPTPYWEFDPSWQLRDINVKCVSAAVTPNTFPDNFSHFSIHARHVPTSGNDPDWEPDDSTFSKDCIKRVVLRDAAVRDAHCRIPYWMLYTSDDPDSDTKHYVKQALLRKANISIKVAMHTWDVNAVSSKPTLMMHVTDHVGDPPTGATGSGTEYDEEDEIQNLGGEYIVGDPDDADGKYIRISGPNLTIKSGDYIAGESGFYISPELMEATNLRARGIFECSTMRVNTISAINGDFWCCDATAIIADIASCTKPEGQYIYVKDQVFSTYDTVLLKNGTQYEMMMVQNDGVSDDGVTSGTGEAGYKYSVKRACHSSGTSGTLAIANITSGTGTPAAALLTFASVHGLTQDCAVSFINATPYATDQNAWISSVPSATQMYIRGVDNVTIPYSAAMTGSGYIAWKPGMAWSKGTAIVKQGHYYTGDEYETIRMSTTSGTASIATGSFPMNYRVYTAFEPLAELKSTGLNIYKGGDITLEYDGTDPAEINFGDDYYIRYSDLGGSVGELLWIGEDTMSTGSGFYITDDNVGFRKSSGYSMNIDTTAIYLNGPITTNLGTNKWYLGAGASTSPSGVADAKVTVTIDGTDYELYAKEL